MSVKFKRTVKVHIAVRSDQPDDQFILTQPLGNVLNRSNGQALVLRLEILIDLLAAGMILFTQDI